MATDKLVEIDHVKDFISREAALDMCDDDYDRIRIRGLPAADVRPVVRGKWERPKGSTPRSWIFRCSVCGERAYFPVPKYFPKGCGYNFCPNCGADCRGGNDGK